MIVAPLRWPVGHARVLRAGDAAEKRRRWTGYGLFSRNRRSMWLWWRDGFFSAGDGILCMGS
jgi:hypothetical protein